MSTHRRHVLVGTGAVLFGAASIGTGTGQTNVSIAIVEVNEREDTVVLENTGDEDLDLGGYRMDWEYNDDQDQTDSFDDDVTIAAGERLVVWTGFQSTEIADVEADVQIADHGNGRINDDDPDVIALLSPDGEVVATSDGEVGGGDNGDDEEGGDGEENGDDGATGDEEDGRGDEQEDEHDDEVMDVQFRTDLSGDNEVPPVETGASGEAHFTLTDHGEGLHIHYELHIQGLEHPAAAHIHLGGPDENGPVVVGLYETDDPQPCARGLLAEGTIRGGLVGPLEGEALDVLADEMDGGSTYVNVHTEENPEGEIRGQIEAVNGE